jgi:hypothetical protein
MNPIRVFVTMWVRPPWNSRFRSTSFTTETTPRRSIIADDDTDDAVEKLTDCPDMGGIADLREQNGQLEIKPESDTLYLPTDGPESRELLIAVVNAINAALAGASAPGGKA